MIFVTTATGPKYVAMAERLKESFQEYSWPRLIVAHGEDYPELDTLWKGRGLKSQFAKLIPDDYQGPVAFVDCDCLAAGPYTGDPVVGPGQVACLISRTKWAPNTGRQLHRVWSPFLAFPNVDTAKMVSAGWYNELVAERPVMSDEPALNRVLRDSLVDVVPTGGSFNEPLPNLKHLAVTSG